MTPVQPVTVYAKSGPFHIAYQVWGEGPVDVLLVPGFISSVEQAWQEVSLARFLRRLSGFARVIAFDKRGMGLSDRDPQRETPTLDERVDDVRAVLRAAGSERACVLAWSEACATAVLLARDHPALVAGLVLVGTSARFSQAPDFPEGVPLPVLERFIEALQEEWGTGVGLELYAPSRARDPRTRAWWASYQRHAATPGAVAASLRLHLDVDVRHALPELAVPALVLHQRNDMVVPVTCGRATANLLPVVRYLELPGEDHLYWLGDQDRTLASIRGFLESLPEGARLKSLRSRRGRPNEGWESLTPAELDVVRLLAAGLTNPQIAERLYISPRTVQTHVAHAFAKLGLRRRSELAAEAGRRLHH